MFLKFFHIFSQCGYFSLYSDEPHAARGWWFCVIWNSVKLNAVLGTWHTTFLNTWQLYGHATWWFSEAQTYWSISTPLRNDLSMKGFHLFLSSVISHFPNSQQYLLTVLLVSLHTVGCICNEIHGYEPWNQFEMQNFKTKQHRMKKKTNSQLT